MGRKEHALPGGCASKRADPAGWILGATTTAAICFWRPRGRAESPSTPAVLKQLGGCSSAATEAFGITEKQIRVFGPQR